MIFNGELMIIYNGIDQQTYGTSWRNYSWLMSSSGVMLSATFEIIMILHLGILGMGSSSTTKTSPRIRLWRIPWQPRYYSEKGWKRLLIVCAPLRNWKNCYLPIHGLVWICLDPKSKGMTVQSSLYSPVNCPHRTGNRNGGTPRYMGQSHRVYGSGFDTWGFVYMKIGSGWITGNLSGLMGM